MKKRIFSVLVTVIVLFGYLPVVDVDAVSSVDENIGSVVSISCGWFDDENDELDQVSMGSGVVMTESGVLTNAHVVYYEDPSSGDLYEYDFCLAGVSENSYTEPTLDLLLLYSDFKYDDEFDYALMNVVDMDGNPYVFEDVATLGNPDSLVHGDDISIIGYPTAAGYTVTSTYGNVSGFVNSTWIKTDAIVEYGNSGGGAFDSNGNFIGIPTIVIEGDLNSYSLIQNINAIAVDLFGDDFVMRDLVHLYDDSNYLCINDDEVKCYNYSEYEIKDDEEDDNDVGSDISLLGGQYDESLHDSELISRMSGSILLQVEEHGEAWYVNPVDSMRYYMANGSVAYEMLRAFGLGITNADLDKIPTVDGTDEMLETGSVCSSNSAARKLSGRILLQVEEHGEAWYISPKTCKRIYMKDGAEAYSIMRFLGLGIANVDLTKMPMGEFVAVE